MRKHLCLNPNVLVAVSKGMQAVKLLLQQILQFLAEAASQQRFTCIIAAKWSSVSQMSKSNQTNIIFQKNNMTNTQGDMDIISSYQLFSAILWGKL